MKVRTTETQWTGKPSWRMIAATPLLLVSAPLLMAGNGLMILAAAIAGRDISYSWETDVEGKAGVDVEGQG